LASPESNEADSEFIFIGHSSIGGPCPMMERSRHIANTAYLRLYALRSPYPDNDHPPARANTSRLCLRTPGGWHFQQVRQVPDSAVRGIAAANLDVYLPNERSGKPCNLPNSDTIKTSFNRAAKEIRSARCGRIQSAARNLTPETPPESIWRSIQNCS